MLEDQTAIKPWILLGNVEWLAKNEGQRHQNLSDWVSILLPLAQGQMGFYFAN